MKTCFLFVSLLLSYCAATAQTIDKLTTVKSLSDNWQQGAYGGSMSFASNGDIITMYHGTNEIHFDPGPDFPGTICSLYDYTRPFIARYSPSGQVLWVKEFFDTSYCGTNWSGRISKVKVDQHDNIIVAGAMVGLAKVDWYTLVDTVGINTNSFSHLRFVAKLSPTGQLIWMKEIRHTQIATTEYGSDNNLDLDEQGNIYISGTSQDSLLIDGTLVGSASSQSTDPYGYVAKLDNNGNVKWAKANTSHTATTFSVNAITVGHGAVYLAGNGYGTLDFSGVNATYAAATNKFVNYIVKLDTSGTPQFIKIIADSVSNGHSLDYILYLALDTAGNLYFPHHFSNVSTIVGDTVLTSPPNGVVLYIAKMKPNGKIESLNQLTHGAMGGYTDVASICFNEANQMYITGYDTGPYTSLGNYVLTDTSIAHSLFVAKYNQAGDVLWAVKKVSPTSLPNNLMSYYYPSSNGTDILVKANQIYLSGYYTSGVGGVARLDNYYLANVSYLPAGFFAIMQEQHNTMQAKVYNDVNRNGVWDSTETARPSTVVRLDTVGKYYTTNTLGIAQALTDTGTFQFSHPVLPRYYMASTTAPSVTFHGYNNIDSSTTFGVYPIPHVRDMKVSVGNIVPQWGAPIAIYVNYANVGTDTVSGYVEVNMDTVLKNITTNPPSDSVSSDSLTYYWNYSNALPGDIHYITITARIDSLVSDSILILGAKVYPIVGDTTPSDNAYTDTSRIRRSVDPNNKEVSPLAVDSAQFQAKVPLTYTINFHNTDADTAYHVFVIDTIDEKMDIATIQTIAASHPYTMQLIERNIVRWDFNDINLPDSVINNPKSYGFVKYTISPSSAINSGHIVRNRAGIYFDFNAPAITNIATVMYGPNTGVWVDEKALPNEKLTLYPNPTTGQVTVNCVGFTGSMQLYNVLGELLLEKEIPRDVQQTTIDIGQYARGTYILKCGQQVGKVIKY